MSRELRNEQKRRYFEMLLESGIASLHLDPRWPGVSVPDRFKQQEWLVLNYSYRFQVQDFRVDDEAVEASLSFSGQPFFCRVPWVAVFAITNEPRTKGLVWEQDMPDEVRERQAGAAQEMATEPHETATAAAPRREPRPGLQVLPGGQKGEPQPGPTRPAGHLRRIK